MFLTSAQYPSTAQSNLCLRQRQNAVSVLPPWQSHATKSKWIGIWILFQYCHQDIILHLICEQRTSLEYWKWTSWGDPPLSDPWNLPMVLTSLTVHRGDLCRRHFKHQELSGGGTETLKFCIIFNKLSKLSDELITVLPLWWGAIYFYLSCSNYF